MEKNNTTQPTIPQGVIERIQTEAKQAAAKEFDISEAEHRAHFRLGYEMAAAAEWHHWNPSYPKEGHPVYKGWDSVKIIGRSRERHKELEHKEWDWRAFYNGWLEGRSDMLQSFRIEWDKMEEVRHAAVEQLPVDYDPIYEDDIWDAVRHAVDNEFRRSGLFHKMCEVLTAAHQEISDNGIKIAQLEERLKAAESRSVIRWELPSNPPDQPGNFICDVLVPRKNDVPLRTREVCSWRGDRWETCYADTKILYWPKEIPAEQYNDEIALLKQSYDTMKAEADRWRGKCQEAENVVKKYL